MAVPPWRLRTAGLADREYVFELNRTTMRDHVEQVWGWDEDEQGAFFDERFDPHRYQVVQAGGEDVGVLIVEEKPDELCLAEIQIHPEWQGRGIGSSVVRAVMARAAAAGKPLTLRVLHVNERARALYERVGFRTVAESETHAYMRWTSAVDD